MLASNQRGSCSAKQPTPRTLELLTQLLAADSRVSQELPDVARIGPLESLTRAHSDGWP